MEKESLHILLHDKGHIGHDNPKRGMIGRDFSYKLSIPTVKLLVLLAQAGHWLRTENSEDSTDMINISQRSSQPKLT